MNWITKLERKFGRYEIHGLMNWIVAGQVFIFGVTMLIDSTFSYNFALIRSAILAGQVWRLVTFVFIPSTFSILWFAFSAYFYYIMGQSLERVWGAFRLNLYFVIGALGAIAACFLVGYVSNYVLLESLFFAYAMIYPERELLLMGILPVKVKWLAWLAAALLALDFVSASVVGKVGILFTLAGFFAFFGADFISGIKAAIRRKSWQQRNRNNWR